MKKKMLKIGIASTFLMCLSTLGAVAFFSREDQNHVDLQVSTEDKFNEEANIEKVSLRRASSGKSVDCSRMYVQTAFDGTNYYLRFATAVKGNLDTITYNADIIDSEVELESLNVASVYRSISADGGKFYHNGTVLLDESMTSTANYYWACYTIKFEENSSFKANNIKVDIDVNDGEYVTDRTVSLNGLLGGDYTLGEYALDCQKDGKTPSFTYEKKLTAYTHNSSQFEIIQGGCTDGEYLYYTMNGSGENNNNKNSAGYILKFDPSNMSAPVASTELIGGAIGGHDNGLGNGNLSYNPMDGMIYSLGAYRAAGGSYKGGQCADFRINPKDMSVENLGNLLEVDGFRFELPSVDTYFSNYAGQTLNFDLENFEYNPSLERWVVTYNIKDSSGANIIDSKGNSCYRTLFFYDKDLKLVENVKQNIVVVNFPADTQYTTQEMTSDENHIYVDFTKYGLSTLHSKIRVFDWDGNEVVENGVSIEGDSNFATTPKSTNIQSVIFLKGDLYVASYQSGSGLHVCKVVYNDNVTSKIKETITDKLNFGEKVEYTNKKGLPLTLSSTQVGTANKEISVNKTLTAKATEGKTGVSYSKFYVAKGMTTDDEYLYVGLNAKTGSDKDTGFDIGIVAKFDVDGTLVATSANSYWWGNGSRMSYYDGMILVSRTNGDAGKGSTYSDTIKYNGNVLAFDAETLELISDNYIPEFDVPAGGTFDMVSQSPDGSKVAVVYYYAEETGTVRRLYTFDVAADGTMTPIESCQGIDVTSRYNGTDKGGIVGVDSNNDYIYLFHSVAKGGVVSVLDYAGNTIKENITIANAGEGTATTKNYQGLAEINGTLYYAITNWGDYTGFGLYQVKDEYTVTQTKNIKIKFDDNNGNSLTPSQTLDVGEKVVRPEDPKYSYTDARGNTYNYVLEDWYNGEKVWNFEKDVVTGPMTLKAKWTFEEDFFAIKENLDVRTEGTTARIMSFNVLADDWNNKPVVDDTRANQAFNTVERYQPDVVGFQEFDDAWYTKSKTLLDGYTLVNADNNKISGTTNYSTLAYNTSRVKLVEWEQVRLKQSDNNYCRNVTTGLFEFIAGENIGKQFIVTSTHWDLKEPQRVIQAKEFASMIKSLEEKYPNTPIMSCGDYNAYDSQSPITTFISESGMYDTKNAETKGLICKTGHLGNGMNTGDRVTSNPLHWLRGPTSFLVTNVQTEEAIDHIFANNLVKSLYHTVIVDTDALNSSDHCPIISDLQF